MSNAEQVRRPHPDAQAFADAFSAADDAFSFAPSAGVSRTLTLSELQSALALEAPVSLEGPVRGRRPAPVVHLPEELEGPEDGLLSLDELGDALARPSTAMADGLDFDFGSGTSERARRRTAARFGHPTATATATSTGLGVSRTLHLVPDPDATELRPRALQVIEEPAPAPRPHRARPAAAKRPRAALADGESWFGPAPATPAQPREDALTPARVLAALPLPTVLRSGGAAQAVEADGRPTSLLAAEPRPPRDPFWIGVLARPDRIALWAVVLGIALVIIAASSAQA